MLLTVDLGNYNVKTSEGVIFSSKFTTTNLNFDEDNEFIIEFEGTKYYMERGTFDKEFNKKDKNYIPLLLAAVYKSIKVSTNTIDLVLGVPASQIASKEEFIKELEGKTFYYNANGKEKSIYFRRVAVVKEGFSAFYTLSREEREQRSLIIDIGSRTINASSFINKKCEKSVTIPIGVLNLYEIIKERENNKGSNLKVEEIEDLIGTHFIGDVSQEKNDFLKQVLNELKLNFNTKLYNVYFCGGGTVVLEKNIKSKITRAKIMDNPLFSNVIGNKNIAKAKWGED